MSCPLGSGGVTFSRRHGGWVHHPVSGACVMPPLKRSPGSRVREIRMHGLKGGASRDRCGVAGGIG